MGLNGSLPDGPTGRSDATGETSALTECPHFHPAVIPGPTGNPSGSPTAQNPYTVLMDLATIERHVIRLRRWNLLWVTVATLGTIILAFLWLGNSVKSSIHQLRCTPTEYGLRLSVSDDGPFVVTHLVDIGYKATATLPEPIAIIDSHGGEVSKETLAKLKWINILGDESRVPPLNEMSALYVNARTSKPPAD